MRDSPSFDATDAQLIDYYGDPDRRRTVTIAGLYVIPLAGIAFIWFMAALRDRYVRTARSEHVILSTAHVVSGALVVVSLFTLAAVELAVAWLAEKGNPFDVDGARSLLALGQASSDIMALRSAAVFVGVSTSRAVRSGLFPRAFGVVSFLVVVGDALRVHRRAGGGAPVPGLGRGLGGAHPRQASIPGQPRAGVREARRCCVSTASCPPSSSDASQSRLGTIEGVRHVWVGSAATDGLVLLSAEIEVSAADAAIEHLAELGIASEDLTLWRVPGIQPLGWMRRVRSTDSGTQVWAEIVGRADEHAQLAMSYLVFMAAAGVIAGIGVLTASAVLLVGAMAISPDLLPISATAIGIVERRPGLALRALRVLMVGLGTAALAAFVATVLLRLFGQVPDDLVLAETMMGEALTHIGPGSLVVAAAAGVAGMLAFERPGGAAVGRSDLGHDDPGGGLRRRRARDGPGRPDVGGVGGAPLQHRGAARGQLGHPRPPAACPAPRHSMSYPSAVLRRAGEEPEASSRVDRLGSGGGVEFAVDGLAVGLDRVAGDVEAGPDGGEGEVGRQVVQHPELGCRERRGAGRGAVLQLGDELGDLLDLSDGPHCVGLAHQEAPGLHEHRLGTLSVTEEEAGPGQRDPGLHVGPPREVARAAPAGCGLVATLPAPPPGPRCWHRPAPARS